MSDRCECGSTEYSSYTVGDDTFTLCSRCGKKLARIASVRKVANSRLCKVCNQPLRGKQGQIYCSARCRQKAARAEKRKDRGNTYVCEVCNAEFVAQRTARYCSAKCRKAASRERAYRRSMPKLMIERIRAEDYQAD